MNLKETLLQIIAGGLDFVSKTALDISDLAEVQIERKNDTSNDYHKPVGYQIQSDSQIYYRWSGVDGDDINVDNDFKLSADNIHLIVVPFDLMEKQADKASIFLHFKQVTTASNKKIRYVEV